MLKIPFVLCSAYCVCLLHCFQQTADIYQTTQKMFVEGGCQDLSSADSWWGGGLDRMKYSKIIQSHQQMVCHKQHIMQYLSFTEINTASSQTNRKDLNKSPLAPNLIKEREPALADKRLFFGGGVLKIQAPASQKWWITASKFCSVIEQYQILKAQNLS